MLLSWNYLKSILKSNRKKIVIIINYKCTNYTIANWSAMFKVVKIQK